jgi:hypothetical protein
MWFLCDSFNVVKGPVGRKTGFRGVLGFNSFWLATKKAKPNSNGNKNK